MKYLDALWKTRRCWFCPNFFDFCARFNRKRVVRSDLLVDIKNGSAVTVAGIVTHRQRPGASSGVVFATLEDEAGTSNLIIWPRVLEEQREALLGAQLLLVRGELQSKDGVVHIVTKRAVDYTSWLGPLTTASRDFH